MNTKIQIVYGVKLRLIPRKDYDTKNAKRFTLNESNQNIWIPNKHLESDGTIKSGENLVYIFKTEEFKHKLRIANGVDISGKRKERDNRKKGYNSSRGRNYSKKNKQRAGKSWTMQEG